MRIECPLAVRNCSDQVYLNPDLRKVHLISCIALAIILISALIIYHYTK